MTRFGRLFQVGAFVTLGAIAGCDNEPKAGNGVNDVRAACELRAGWNRTNNDCSICESAVISPRCECESLAAFSAACFDQETARQDHCAREVDVCVFSCDRTDCACIEACYVQGDACKTASDARDGCIAEACADYCK